MNTQMFTSEQWQRHEKFVKMFRAAKQRKRAWQEKMEAKLKEEECYTRTEIIEDEGEENYIAVIVKRSHPHIQTIINVLSEQIEMFRTNKPN